MDDNQRNLATSVSPSYFRDGEGDEEVKQAIKDGLQAQGAWAIDGCFYSLRTMNQQEETICKHATIEQLNPETGKVKFDN